jgi:acetylornithine deacetylase/succinyl-diaminopimelate desuccinylase-like protein
MLKEGLFRDVRPDAVLGLHAHAELPSVQSGISAARRMRQPTTRRRDQGQVGTCGMATGERRSGGDCRTGRAGAPDNPISSSVPHEPSVITVAQIHGGIRDNIIPPDVRWSGTVRLFSRTAQDEVERHMREILDGVSRAAGGSYTLTYTRQAPLNVSDPSLVRSLLPTLLRVLGQEHVVAPPPWMAADDFAYLAAEVPAFFFALGTVKPGTKSGNNHTPTFLADDGALPVGMRAVAHMVLDFLTSSASPVLLPRQP